MIKKITKDKYGRKLNSYRLSQKEREFVIEELFYLKSMGTKTLRIGPFYENRMVSVIALDSDCNEIAELIGHSALVIAGIHRHDSYRVVSHKEITIDSAINSIQLQH